MKTLLVLGFVCLFHVGVLAQTGGLAGTVTDRQTAQPLNGATVRIVGTQLGTFTNGNGKFKISGIVQGTAVVRITLVGYEPVEQKIYIKSNTTQDGVFTMLQSSIKTEEIVVSANRRVQAVQDVPISVSSMSSSDLLQRNITKLDDALRYVSGISIAKDQINIRGASGFALGVGSRTMVLLDGFPLLSGDNGDIKFDVMPVADIARIEVIKGAGSALYGTGAMGGVVSMFTKQPEEGLHGSANVYAGGYTELRHDEWIYRDTPPFQWGADARITQSSGELNFNLSGGFRSDESYRYFDRNYRGFGYGKIQYKPSERSSFSVASFFTQNQSENFVYWKDLHNATKPPDSQDLTEILWTQKIALFGEWIEILSPKTMLIVRPGMFKTRYENRIDERTLDSNQSTAYAWNMDVQVTSNVMSDLTITAGLTGKLNHVRSDVYGQQLQSLFSGYVQGEYTLPNQMIFTLGLRADREETRTLEPQLEFSPKAGWSWPVTEHLQLRASAGRGFRAATVAERYASIRYGPFNVTPNPNVKPESSWSFEIGSRFQMRDWIFPFDVDLAVFDNELYSMIEPTFSASQNASIIFTNVTRARVLGSELTVRAMVLKDVSVESGLTLMLPTDLTLNETLKYRNNVLWYTRAIVSFFSNFEFQAEYRFQNRIENIDEQLSLFIPDADARVPVHVVDARLFWSLKDATAMPLRIGLIGRNILDYYYNEAVANLSPTRSIVVQLEYRH